MSRMKVGLLGLGEADSAVARDLVAAGVEVFGYDPDPNRGVEEMTQLRNEAEVAQAVDLLLEVAERVRPHLRPGQVLADLNTAAPSLKRQMAELVAPTGALFADVTLSAISLAWSCQMPIRQGPSKPLTLRRWAGAQRPRRPVRLCGTNPLRWVFLDSYSSPCSPRAGDWE